MFEKILALLQKEKLNEANANCPRSDSGSEAGGAGNAFKFLSRIEFLIFKGSNPRNWIKKCGR